MRSGYYRCHQRADERPDRVVCVPDAVRREPSADEQAAWFAQLPTVFTAAAALFTDAAGRVLLVKPNYRAHWTGP